MGISLLDVLLNSISGFFHVSSLQSINLELFCDYYRKTEAILKPLKTILDGIVEAEISSELLQKAYVELGCAIDELRELFETWQILSSKVYFVLQVESLIVKVRNRSLEVVELLMSCNRCCDDESFEECAVKIKSMEYEMLSLEITKAIKDEEGSRATSSSLAKIAEYLSLNSNQELLIELVSLEKLKEEAELAERGGEVEYILKTIALISRMHNNLVTMKQSEKYNNSSVPIPPDFCCSLSLELMTDPVIVASGQTYERAFIQQWIDLGLAVCPKTRQSLARTNLTPNFTVKALISSWCESNNVKLPDPTQSVNSNRPSSFLVLLKCGETRDHSVASSGSTPSSDFLRKCSSSSSASLDIEKTFPKSSSSRFSMPLSSKIALFPEKDSLQVYNRARSAPSTLCHSVFLASNRADGKKPILDASVEVALEQPRPEPRTCQLPIWNRQSERFFPRIVSSYAAAETRAELAEVEGKARELIEDLKSGSIEKQRSATAELRFLAKQEMDNRIAIANSGAIALLVNLLLSEDEMVQENAVTALLNLSINDNNKYAIANADPVEPLVYVLETGTPEARENTAATLYSISVIDECKVRIGRSGAIKSLVNLLGNGTPRGKKDAATALFSLSILHENKSRIVEAGAVKHLLELMDPSAALIDKAVAVLSNLSTIHSGRIAIGQERGIPALVNAVELGSARVKEHAAAALLQLCTNSVRYCGMALRAGTVPPLVALSRRGTPRAREKALGIICCLRNYRNPDVRKD